MSNYLKNIEAILPFGYQVCVWSPGDGKTRYRFFFQAPKEQDYFGPMSPIYTALGFAEAKSFLYGLRQGQYGVTKFINECA